MSDHDNDIKTETLMEKISEKVHGHDGSSSSSDSDDGKSSSLRPRFIGFLAGKNPFINSSVVANLLMFSFGKTRKYRLEFSVVPRLSGFCLMCWSIISSLCFAIF